MQDACQVREKTMVLSPSWHHPPFPNQLDHYPKNPRQILGVWSPSSHSSHMRRKTDFELRLYINVMCIHIHITIAKIKVRNQRMIFGWSLEDSLWLTLANVLAPAITASLLPALCCNNSPPLLSGGSKWEFKVFW